MSSVEEGHPLAECHDMSTQMASGPAMITELTGADGSIQHGYIKPAANIANDNLGSLTQQQR